MELMKEESGGCSRSTARRLEDAHSGCGVLEQFRRRANWPRDQIAAAVWAYAFQARMSAVATEGALVGADHGFRGVGREITVAALAAGAQLKHGHLTDRD